MTTCVLVASHIRYDGQLNLLKECLTSLLEQTYKTDIYVSISFENDRFKEDFINMIQPLFTNVNFLVCKKKKYQLEHLKYLCILINDMKKYNWVFFCDDDDTYLNNRVETFMNYINVKNENELVIVKEKGNYEGIDENHPILIYWLYVVKLDILLIFFNDFIKNDKVLKNNNADYLLKAYFERCHNEENTINDTLYIYNQSNSNSISNNKTNQFKKILYYNVVNFDENSDNVFILNKKTNKEQRLTKRDYIENVPHYHLLKNTLKILIKYDTM
jgi:hypothetical protein